MRYLILGDVHGNLPALELVLAAEKGNYDVLISHGDVVNYGPWSNECVDLLAQQDNKILLKGNHEESFISGNYPGTKEVARAFFEFNVSEFSRLQAIEDYIDDYQLPPYSIQHTIGDKYIFKDTDIQIDRHYIVGHSHQQFYRHINGFDLYNTGSVGQNREFINVINYIVWDTKGKPELKSIIYNPDIIIDEFKARHYPEICINYYSNKKRL